MKIYESATDLELLDLGLIRAEVAADVFVTAMRGAMAPSIHDKEVQAAEVFFARMREDYIGAVKQHLEEKAYVPHKEAVRSGGRRDTGQEDAVGDSGEGQPEAGHASDQSEQVSKEEDADSSFCSGIAKADSNYLLDRGVTVGHKCKAGGSKLVVMYDGSIIPCEAFKGAIDKFPIFILGNIADGPHALRDAKKRAEGIRFLTCARNEGPLPAIQALSILKEDLRNHGYGEEYLRRVDEIAQRIIKGEPPPDEPERDESI